MPEAKWIEQKMRSFYEALFTMTSFSAKNLNNIAGWEKKYKSLKWPQKFLNYVLQWYLAGDQKKCIYFWNLDINSKLKEKNEKKEISLNISKNFATIFDHRLDLIKAHN